MYSNKNKKQHKIISAFTTDQDQDRWTITFVSLFASVDQNQHRLRLHPPVEKTEHNQL